MLKKILIPIKYISQHPLTKNNKTAGFVRFIRWQIKSRLNSEAHIIPWIGTLKLSVLKSMHGATGCIYVGLPEFRDMSFLLHFLKPDSFFIDIGANIGVYSLLAAGNNGTKTIGIEPIPKTFNFLLENVKLNQLANKITCLNIGLSDKSDYLYFTKDKDTVNHVVENKGEDTVKVKVDTLDNIIEKKLNSTTLIKIDVEGFELNVLKGGTKTLQNKHLQAIIVELNGSSERYGLNDAMVDGILTQNKFLKFDYNPFNRTLTPLKKFHSEENTLYIRASEVTNIETQLKSANSFKIFNKTI